MKPEQIFSLPLEPLRELARIMHAADDCHLSGEGSI